jgi:ankyrin repeat protein
MRTLAHQLVEKLWEHVLQLQDSEISKLIREPSRLLFDAAESGSLEFLIILIRSYPDLIWKVDHNNRSLFHIAVLYRHETIFNLIYEIGAIKDLIAAYKDDKNNNILHLAGNLAPHNRLQIVSGAALQMQRELLWFKVNNNTNQYIVIGFLFFLIVLVYFFHLFGLIANSSVPSKISLLYHDS